MSRSTTTALYTRVDNSFSNPVVGTTISPTDADTFFDDVEASMNSFIGTSATSLAIGTGSKSFTTQTAKSFLVGMSVQAFSQADHANSMSGTVTSYNAGTGALVLEIFSITGSGTLADWLLITSGARGATGTTGTTGATGATSGIKQTYSTTTADADPGAGVFRLNNATPASATAAYLDNADAGAATVSSLWDLIDDSTNTIKGNIRFEKSTDPTVWAQFQVTGSVVDGTGYRKLTLQAGAGSGAFTNLDTFAITFNRAGDKGADGVGAGDMTKAVYDIADNGRIDLAAGGTNAALADPNADRIFFWDDSGGATDWLAPGVGLSIGGTSINALAQGFALLNGSITASAAAGALTVAIKTLAGADPSASDPVTVQFRNATLATGDYSTLTLTAALSLVISSGSTMGFVSATAGRLWLVIFNDGGTPRLGLVNCRSSTKIYQLAEHVRRSSTAEGGAGAADSSGVIYTGTAVTDKPFRIVGFLEWPSGITTAGTWTWGGTEIIQPFWPGVPRPGSVIQSEDIDHGTATSNSVSSAYSTTGVTITMTLTSPCNPVRILWGGACATTDSGNGVICGLIRSGNLIGKASSAYISAGTLANEVGRRVGDFPGTVGPHTWAVGVKPITNGQAALFPNPVGTGVGGSMEVSEIMG